MPRPAAATSTRPARARRTQGRPRAVQGPAAPSRLAGLLPQFGRGKPRRRGGRNVRNVRREAAAPTTLRGGAQAVGGGPLGPALRRFGSLLGRFAVAGVLAWGALVGVRSAYAFVTTSPRFAATHLIYTPTAHLSSERVATLMGIEEGTNLLSLDLKDLEAKIAGDRWVSSVTVARELPDTLRVEVVEHEPAAILLADRFYLIDREGRPFKRLEKGERGELPVITGVDRKLLLAGLAGPRITRALEAMAAYQQGARPRLGEVHVGVTDEVTLTTAESRTQLRLGRDGIEDKLGRFDALRAALGDRADRLAVVHLDAIGRTGDRERIIASFADDPSEADEGARGSAAWSALGVGRDTHGDAPAPAGPSAAAERPARSEGKDKDKGKGPGSKKKKVRRIPRYE
ncbi:MAG: FtsQ-type POTRA domain-containing protein [Nannocystaceae bacterium]